MFLFLWLELQQARNLLSIHFCVGNNFIFLFQCQTYMTAYLPLIYKYLAQELTPDLVCKVIKHFCSKSSCAKMSVSGFLRKTFLVYPLELRRLLLDSLSLDFSKILQKRRKELSPYCYKRQESCLFYGKCLPQVD